MISSGDNFEKTISGVTVNVRRVWGSGVRTCGSYWIGLENVAYFVLPGFGLDDRPRGLSVVLIGGKVVFETTPKTMDEAMEAIESEISRAIESRLYGRASLKSFQRSQYFNRGEMPVIFEMEE